MKLFGTGFIISLLLLQGCAQNKAPQEGSSSSEQSQQASNPASNPAAAQPESLKLYTESEKFFRSKDYKSAFNLLDKAAAAADKEKNSTAYMLCREEQARLKMGGSEFAAASELLENSIKKFDREGEDPNLRMRTDLSKALLAESYAKSGKVDLAEKMYKDNLAVARSAKPLMHKRIAFWLKNYSDFYGFQKKKDKAQSLLDECKEELKKDGSAAPAGTASR